jgi:hypothetical protein
MFRPSVLLEGRPQGGPPALGTALTGPHPPHEFRNRSGVVAHPGNYQEQLPICLHEISRRKSAWCKKAELSDRADSETTKEAPHWKQCITST